MNSNYPHPQQPPREKPQQIMNAVITTGQYTTREGKQKKSYLTIGKLFILDAYPTANQTYVRSGKFRLQ